MIRLSEKYRPTRIKDIVGQPEAVARLEAYAADPYANCFGFLGPPGTGKTTAAMALLWEIGCVDSYPGFKYMSGSDFTGVEGKAEAKRTYDWLQCCPMFGECRDETHIHGLVIEEMSKMSQDAMEHLKSSLDICLPRRAMVIVTSNDLAKISDTPVGQAFLERFEWINFDSTEVFMAASIKRARSIWRMELTTPFGMESPSEVELMRLAKGPGGFSFRTLLRAIEQRVTVVRHQQKVASGVRTDQSEILNDR